MAWRGSLSRSLLSTARASSFRSVPSAAPRVRPPLAAPRIQSPRLSFSNPRTVSELGGVQSLLPLHSVVAAARLTSHLAVDARGMEKMGDAKKDRESSRQSSRHGTMMPHCT